MVSNGFVFSVTAETYETHRQYGFVATGDSDNPLDSAEDVISGQIPAGHYCMISNIFNVREGDIIFFYVAGEGFKGIYEAAQSPFFDATEIGPVPATRPFRIKINCLFHFDIPVPENALFSTSERLRTFWLWYHNKIRRSGRGCTPIDPDAKNALIELLIKFNTGQESPRTFRQSSYPSLNVRELRNLKAKYKPRKERIESEYALEALIMAAFRDKSANTPQVFGDFANLEWHADQIPYHISGRTIDMMLYHRSKAFLNVDTRFQISIIELKSATADMKELHQLLEYCDWAGNQLVNGDTHLIQPILVAHSFGESLLEYQEKERDYRSSFKSLKLVEYRYNHELGLRLSEVGNQATLNPERFEQIRRRRGYQVQDGEGIEIGNG